MIGVLFEASTFPGEQERYLELAGELKPLLADIDGFISIEQCQWKFNLCYNLLI